MIDLCPIDAIGDSVTICKVGTNNVIGSGRGPMTWTEFIQSEYFGGEGQLLYCQTGAPVFEAIGEPRLSYKNRQLLADQRMRLGVYDPRKAEWVELDLPTWRKTISAAGGKLRVAPDSLVFRPPLHGKEAFAAVAKEYDAETKRSDHYLVTRTVDRLLVCALSGDTASARKLENIETDFASYYSGHEDSKALLGERMRLYRAYQAYLAKGGRKQYYDLSEFPYFARQGGKNYAAACGLASRRRGDTATQR